MGKAEFAGVCGHDSANTGRLGCVTANGARFVHTLERNTQAYLPAVPGQVRMEVDGATELDEAVRLRRHGGGSLCAPLDSDSEKLPLHLEMTSGEQAGAEWILAPGFSDASMLRAHLGAEVMRRFGVLAPVSQLVRLAVNGQYIGVYTLVQDLGPRDIAEQLVPQFAENAGVAPSASALGQPWLQVTRSWQARPQDFVLEAEVGDWLVLRNHTNDPAWIYTQHSRTGQLGFAAADGVVENGVVECRHLAGQLYEPATSLSSFHPHQFVPRTGSTAADTSPAAWYADALALWEVLQAGLASQVADRPAWRERLEDLVDVDGLLRWLAATTALNNWDTYGQVPHNFRLYARPAGCGAPRLTLIPMDFDMTLDNSHYLPPDIRKVTPHWPLIHVLARDPVYFRVYLESLVGWLVGKGGGGQRRRRERE